MATAARLLSPAKLHVLGASDHGLLCPTSTAARSLNLQEVLSQTGGLLTAMVLSPVIALMWLAWLIDGESAAKE